ncbi:hypothetical protein GALL_462990 [mine drainage metagenome]|uniref:Uncharacterized protein n=1 Tax=mine drainage metagenome TaxID=410659 RepID=A0A1J5PKM2_9ZZZZ
MLDGLDEIAGFDQALVGAGIEPGIAAAHDLHTELVALEINAVEIGNLQFASRRWLQVGGDIDDLVVVEIKTGDGIIAPGADGLFFQAGGAALRIEGHHAVTLGVLHVVGKNGGALIAQHGLLKLSMQIVAVKNVVAQHQGTGCIADEVLADDECLRQAIRAGLHGVLQVEAPVAAVTEQLLEARGILRRGDDENVLNPGQHQGTERVVDHRLVVNRKQLLGNNLGHRVETGTGAAGEDDAFSGGWRVGNRKWHIVQLILHFCAIRPGVYQCGPLLSKTGTTCLSCARFNAGFRRVIESSR